MALGALLLKLPPYQKEPYFKRAANSDIEHYRVHAGVFLSVPFLGDTLKRKPKGNSKKQKHMQADVGNFVMADLQPLSSPVLQSDLRKSEPHCETGHSQFGPRFGRPKAATRECLSSRLGTLLAGLGFGLLALLHAALLPLAPSIWRLACPELKQLSPLWPSVNSPLAVSVFLQLKEEAHFLSLPC